MKTTPDGAGEASLRYTGWRVVFACYLAAVFCWGFALYGHGVYLAELNRLHGWSTTTISGATTAFYFATAAMVAFVSDAIARFGPRAVMLTGAACFACAMALLAIIVAPWQLYAVYMVMAVGAATMHVGAISNVIGLWFERRRGLALSLALNGASSGGILVTPVLLLAIAAYGFATALTGAAIAFVLVLMPVLALWTGRPAAISSKDLPPPPPASWTRSRALRSRAFWSVAAPFAIGLTAQVGFLVHQVAFMQPILGRAEAGIAVAVLTAAAIAGRFVLGAIAHRVDIRRFSAWSLLSQALALAAMIVTGHPAALYAACAVYGLSAGNLITLPSLTIQREFEAASFGMLVGLSWAICQFTYALGPGVLGALRDWSGSYALPIALCIALKLAAAALVLLRPKPEQA